MLNVCESRKYVKDTAWWVCAFTGPKALDMKGTRMKGRSSELFEMFLVLYPFGSVTVMMQLTPRELVHSRPRICGFMISSSSVLQDLCDPARAIFKMPRNASGLTRLAESGGANTYGRYYVERMSALCFRLEFGHQQVVPSS